MIKICISVTSHALDPLPLSQTVTPSRTPSPSSVTYFMDGPHPFYLKDDNEPCHRAKLVTSGKCQNNTRTLTLPAQSQDINPIENLRTLEIVKRHPTIKRKLIESLTAAWNRGVTNDHLVKLSTQFRHNAEKRL